MSLTKAAVKTPDTTRPVSVSHSLKTDTSSSITSPLEQILVLQRSIGNKAVGRLLQSGLIQTKLRIGSPGDIYEQEADRVADELMRMPDHVAVGSQESGVTGINTSIQAKPG